MTIKFKHGYTNGKEAILMPAPPNHCLRCNVPCADAYCSSCVVKLVNQIVPYGGKRVRVVVESEFDRLVRG